MKKLLPVFLLIFLLAQELLASDITAPTIQVKATIDAVIKILQQKNLSAEQRSKALSSAVQTRFDFRAMSQRTLARHWKNALPQQQKKFQKLFTQLLTATYIGRIETYTDEHVAYGRERISKQQKGKQKAIVDTQIVTSSVEIPVSYKLLRKGDEWLIYDVVVEEVSLIRNFRSSYANIIEKEGIAGLLERMTAKIEEMNNSKASAQER